MVSVIRLLVFLLGSASVSLLTKISIALSRLDEQLTQLKPSRATSQAPGGNHAALGLLNETARSNLRGDLGLGMSSTQDLVLIPKKIHQIWISRATGSAVRPARAVPGFIQARVDKMHTIHEATGWECRVWGNELWELYKDETIIKAYRAGSEIGQFDDLTIPFLADLCPSSCSSCGTTAAYSWTSTPSRCSPSTWCARRCTLTPRQ